MNTEVKKFLQVTIVTALVAVSASVASAQAINSGAQPIALNAQLAESLTVNLSAAAVNFTLAAGSAVNAGSTNITATTAWVLKPGRTVMTVDAYFASAAAATTASVPRPCTLAASVRQDNLGWSSTRTVQAPHSPPSQPVLVPVRPTVSRR